LLPRMRQMKAREKVLEETIIDLQEVRKSRLHLYNEYLIEVVKAPSGEGYLARVYELVASGHPCDTPQAALNEAVSLLCHSEAVC